MGGETRWVLVVDDDSDNRETMLDVLNVAGYAATATNSGAGALALLQSEKPCLVLADFIMRDRNGKELLFAARRMLDDGAPPFIFVSVASPLPRWTPCAQCRLPSRPGDAMSLLQERREAEPEPQGNIWLPGRSMQAFTPYRRGTGRIGRHADSLRGDPLEGSDPGDIRGDT